MRPKLTLARKIFLIVLFPLVFQLALLAVVLSVVDRCECDYGAQSQIDRTLVAVTACLAHAAEAGLGDYIYFLSRDKSALQSARDSVTEMSADMGVLKALAKDFRYDKELASISELVDATEKASERFGSISASMPDGARTFRTAQTSLVDLAIGANEIIEKQLHNAVSRLAYYNEMRKILDMILKTAILASVLVTLAWSLSFNGSVRKRLGVLKENTLLYAAGQPLLAELEGDDEIANLDKIFRKSARLLEDAGRRERVIVDNTANVIFALDTDGRILSINKAVFRLWGFSPEECLGLRLSTIIAGTGKSDLRKQLPKVSENGEGSFESQLRRKDGTLIDILWVLRWMAGDQTFAGIAHDVSERKRAERMTLEFSILMRRGLQAPLDYMRNVFKDIGSSILYSTKARNKATAAEFEINRLLALVDDFLKIDKLADMTAKPAVHTNRAQDLMHKAAEAIGDWAMRREVTLIVGRSNATVFAETDQIVRVLINLISNAIKYSEANSSVLIEASETEEYVEFSVTDKGPGIPVEDQAKVFEKFKQLEQTKEMKSKGTGLGLAICQSIVSRHNGKIGVTSDGVSGSCFWFRLPKRTGSNSEIFGDLFEDA